MPAYHRFMNWLKENWFKLAILGVLGYYILALHEYTIFGSSDNIFDNISIGKKTATAEETIFTILYFALLGVLFYLIHRFFKVKPWTGHDKIN